jgi:AcrR family transcriptional regulator
MVRTGRRPAQGGEPPGPSTREGILASARREFAAGGFERATIRRIAAGAGVDPALVHHYFGTKDDLLIEAIRMPILPDVMLERMTRDDPGRVGEAVARLFFSVWEQPESRPILLGLLRSAMTHERAAEMLRDTVTRLLLVPVAEVLEGERSELRAGLAATQLIGLALARYVVGIRPIAEASVDDLVTAVAPTIQRYLTADL